MKKSLFKELADVTAQLKELKDKEAFLKKQVSAEMQRDEVDKVEADYGTFYFTNRKTWKYPEALTKAENDIKDQKKAAQSDGSATFEESLSLTFRASKNNEADEQW